MESRLKIFMNTNTDVRKNWKLKRDSSERKKNKEYILKEINLRTKDYFNFIEPQKKHSNLIIEFTKINDVGLVVECKFYFDSEIDIQKLINYLNYNNIFHSHEFNGLEDKQELIVKEFDSKKLYVQNIMEFTSKELDFPFELFSPDEDTVISTVTKILYVILLDYYLR